MLEQAGPAVIGSLVLSSTELRNLREKLAEQLGGFHAENLDLVGIGREKLRLLLTPRLPKDVFLGFLGDEAAARRIVLGRAFVRLSRHEVQLSPEDETLFQRILPYLLGEA